MQPSGKAPLPAVLPDFRTFRFGFAEAEVEGARDPELLLRGFLDPGGSVDEIINGHKFLILGYKGSGKSAIAEHLRLRAEADPHLFVTVTTLSNFPFAEFGEIVGGQSGPESRLPTAWAWLLLVQLFGSLTRDQGTEGHRGEFPSAEAAMKQMGLLPAPELKKVARISSKGTFKLQVPLIFEGTIERDLKDADERIPLFTDRLREIVSGFRSGSRHILVIDGLDDILTSQDIQYESLAALVLETSRLNLAFQRARSLVKVVLLCRTDLFERLPGANKNKIRQDSSLTLDWYHNPRDPQQSLLTTLANLRARLTDDTVTDVIDQYIPKSVSDRQQPKSFIFDHTRHTPRDFLTAVRFVEPTGLVVRCVTATCATF